MWLRISSPLSGPACDLPIDFSTILLALNHIWIQVYHSPSAYQYLPVPHLSAIFLQFYLFPAKKKSLMQPRVLMQPRIAITFLLPCTCWVMFINKQPPCRHTHKNICINNLIGRRCFCCWGKLTELENWTLWGLMQIMQIAVFL